MDTLPGLDLSHAMPPALAATTTTSSPTPTCETPSADKMRLGMRGVVALLQRNSTASQVDNNRSWAQVEDMEPQIRLLGFDVEVLDEQATRGIDLASRPVAQRAIEGVKTGRFIGIACLDLTRATRDPESIDGRILKRICRQNHALFMTRDRVYDFRNQRDDEAFDREAQFAAWEYRAIRQRLWTEGILVRASREPFYRGRVPIGYRSVPETIKLRVGSSTRAKWEKDPAQANMMERVREAFESTSNLSETVVWLNSRGYVPPRKRPWSARVLRFLLNNPIYSGKYQFGRTSPQSSDIWKSDRAMRVFDVQHLAYWDDGDVLAWRAKFMRPTLVIQRRRRKFVHPLLGLIVCNACETPMIGFGPLGYRCRLWHRDGLGRGCPRPQSIREWSAFRALKTLLPEVLAPNLDQLARAIPQLQERQSQFNRGVAELSILREREAIFEEDADGYRQRGLRTEEKHLDRLGQVRRRIAELESEIAMLDSFPTVADELACVVQRLCADPAQALTTFEHVDPDLQGEVLRILLAQVAIEKIGGRPSKKFEVSWYKPRMLNASDTTLEKVRIREESAAALRAVRPRLDDLFRDASSK